jgi:hypothetical protein
LTFVQNTYAFTASSKNAFIGKPVILPGIR